mmetsp:Transcript_130776/g.364454  ORF Transcript_130776/g.364454 Transcript_130776/m.364454 type:complete len:275 (-) Transcript_130776:224-1048(-)
MSLTLWPLICAWTAKKMSNQTCRFPQASRKRTMPAESIRTGLPSVLACSFRHCGSHRRPQARLTHCASHRSTTMMLRYALRHRPFKLSCSWVWKPPSAAIALGTEASPRRRSDCVLGSLPHKRTTSESPGLYPMTSTSCCHAVLLPTGPAGVQTSEPGSPATRQLQKRCAPPLRLALLRRPPTPRKTTLRSTMSWALTHGRASEPGTSSCTSRPVTLATRPFRPCTVVTVWPTCTLGGSECLLLAVDSVPSLAAVHCLGRTSSAVSALPALPLA